MDLSKSSSSKGWTVDGLILANVLFEELHYILEVGFQFAKMMTFYV